MKHRYSYGSALAVLATAVAVVVPQAPALAEQALGQTAAITDDTPSPSHYYSFTSRTGYWSVIGILPPANVDYDLEVTAPNGTKTYSAWGAGFVDFVVVNGNYPCPAASTYAARVYRYSGSGDYRLAVDTGHVSGVGSQVDNYVYLRADFLAVSDVYLRQGARYIFLAPPDRPGHLSQLFILGSDPSNPDTCVRSRNNYIAVTDGLDDWEVDGVQVPRDGWYAAVRIAPDQASPLPFWITPQS